MRKHPLNYEGSKMAQYIMELRDPVKPKPDLEREWEPMTGVGLKVKEGKVDSLSQLFKIEGRVPEWQIVDWFLQDLKAIRIESRRVARHTAEGPKSSFRSLVVIGNEDGFVGVGVGKFNERRESIVKAKRNAKKKIVPVLRGCGSWECRCQEPHSVPYKLHGKAGSTRIILLPGPRGLGLVAGKVASIVLELAGVKDVWTKTMGETRNPVNFARATYDALMSSYDYI